MTPPRRCWFAFSLRTLFVGVTLAAIVLGWVNEQRRWIARRNQFIWGVNEWPSGAASTATQPPWPLGIFGAYGYDGPLVVEEGVTDLDLKRLQRLFPEAEVRRRKDGEFGQFTVRPFIP